MELVKGACEVTEVSWYAAISITDGLPITRHPTAKRQYVLAWPQADLVIPWPNGLTAMEAVITWAQERLEARHAD